jgi:hypothetical protein
MKPSRAGPRRQLPGSPFNVTAPVEPAEQYSVHDLVTHDKYGLGAVIAIDDAGGVLIDFGAHHARITLPCAKLSKL